MSSARIERLTVQILTVPIDALDWDTAIDKISRWAQAKESRYVCICNAHSCVTAEQDADLARALTNSDIATPDGAPVAWMMRRQGFPGQQRINGPDLMWRYCEKAARRGEAIYLYGGTQRTLDLLQRRLNEAFPGLHIAGAWSPPFRPLTEEEEEADVARINSSGAGTIWVGLGCPKQERWMAAHRGRIHGVMIGVGAAFDYHAGVIKRAPYWMQNVGLEWLHRLLTEPRRLWKRYLVTNSLFIVLAARQLLGRRN